MNINPEARYFYESKGKFDITASVHLRHDLSFMYAEYNNIPPALITYRVRGCVPLLPPWCAHLSIPKSQRCIQHEILTGPPPPKSYVFRIASEKLGIVVEGASNYQGDQCALINDNVGKVAELVATKLPWGSRRKWARCFADEWEAGKIKLAEAV